jgi:hypothetical protein
MAGLLTDAEWAVVLETPSLNSVADVSRTKSCDESGTHRHEPGTLFYPFDV